MSSATPSRRARLRALLEGLARRAGGPATPAGPVLVRFEGRGEGTFPTGSTLLAAAVALEAGLSHYCGGNGTCGTCRVEILDGAGGLSPMEGRERMVLGQEKARLGHRLACQAKLRGAVVVKIPDWF